MTETVTGHQLGVYILEKYDGDHCSWCGPVKEVIGIFTKLDSLNLAIDKLVKNSGIKRKQLKYRLVPKDVFLVDLPSITEKAEDVYSW